MSFCRSPSRSRARAAASPFTAMSSSPYERAECGALAGCVVRCNNREMIMPRFLVYLPVGRVRAMTSVPQCLSTMWIAFPSPNPTAGLAFAARPPLSDCVLFHQLSALMRPVYSPVLSNLDLARDQAPRYSIRQPACDRSLPLSHHIFAQRANRLKKR